MKELFRVGKMIDRSISLKEQLAGKSLCMQVKNNQTAIILRKLQDGVTSIPLEDQYCCIEIAINNQNLEMLKVLLQMLGPNLNVSQYILKIINKAVMTNNLDIIKTTLDYLAMYLDNEESLKVLQLAVEKDNVKIIKNVLENLGTYISKECYQYLLYVNDLSNNFNKKEINTILEKFNNATKYYSIIPFNNNLSKKPYTKYYNLIVNTQSKELRKKVLKHDIQRVKEIIEDGVTTIDYASLVIGVRIAIQNQEQEMISILINTPGFQLQTQDVGCLLKEIVLNNNPEIVQTLLKTLAPQVINKYAEESLLLAVTKKNVEIVSNILKNLRYKISPDCYQSALHIAKYSSQEITGLLASIMLRHKTTPEALTVTKSNSRIHSNTNLLSSKSIEESNNHNMPSTENNQRNDFKTGNNDTVDQSKRSTSKDNISSTILTEDLPPDIDGLDNKSNPEDDHYSTPQETPSTDSNDDTHIKSNPKGYEMTPILERCKTHNSSSYPNYFDKDKEIEDFYKSCKFTQDMIKIGQETIKIGKEIIDLKAKSKNTTLSDRVPTSDIILENKDIHHLKTEIDIHKLDVKKIKEDLKKYIPNVITNHAVRAFSLNNDNQIFPKGNDDIIMNNYNPSNIIEALFFNAQSKIMQDKLRNEVTNKLANELNELPQCGATFLDTFNIIEFKDINGSALKIEILPPKTLGTQPQINILPTPSGSKDFSGALSIERMDISGNILKPKVYDCIRIENGNPVEIVYSDPKPNQKNSRVDQIVRDYNLINTRYTNSLYQSSQDYGMNAFTQLT